MNKKLDAYLIIAVLGVLAWCILGVRGAYVVPPSADRFDYVSSSSNELEFKQDVLYTGGRYIFTVQEYFGDSARRVDIKDVQIVGFRVDRGRYFYKVADFRPLAEYRDWIISGNQPQDLD